MFKKSISVALIVALISGNAMALPQGGNVVHGNATINSSGNTMNINQTTNRADIHWNSFDIGKTETVNFNSLNRSDITINKVTGNNPSLIQGILSANHTVAILNDKGMVITKDAKINMGAFIASTAKNYSFHNERLKLSDLGDGEIKNYGVITINDGGNALLFGKKVYNNGDITANYGSIHLASGKSATIDMGNGFRFPVRGYDIEQEDTLQVGSEVTNTGKLISRGGIVELTTKQLHDIRAGAINLDGVIDVTNLNNGELGYTGRVEIESSGNLNNNAKIYANDLYGAVNTKAKFTNNFTGNIEADNISMQGDGFNYRGRVSSVDNKFTVITNQDLKIADGNVSYPVIKPVPPKKPVKKPINKPNVNKNNNKPAPVVIGRGVVVQPIKPTAVRNDNKKKLPPKPAVPVTDVVLSTTPPPKVPESNSIYSTALEAIGSTANEINLYGKNITVENLSKNNLIVNSSLNMVAGTPATEIGGGTITGNVKMLDKLDNLQTYNGGINIKGNELDLGRLASNKSIELKANNKIAVDKLTTINNDFNVGNTTKINVALNPESYAYNPANPNKIDINSINMLNQGSSKQIDINTGQVVYNPHDYPATNILNVSGIAADVNIGNIHMSAVSDNNTYIGSSNSSTISGYNVNIRENKMNTVSLAPNSNSVSNIFYSGQNVKADSTIINTSNPNNDTGFTYIDNNYPRGVIGSKTINYNYTGQ